jgi:hypothetical protein
MADSREQDADGRANQCDGHTLSLRPVHRTRNLNYDFIRHPYRGRRRKRTMESTRSGQSVLQESRSRSPIGMFSADKM